MTLEKLPTEDSIKKDILPINKRLFWMIDSLFLAEPTPAMNTSMNSQNNFMNAKQKAYTFVDLLNIFKTQTTYSQYLYIFSLCLKYCNGNTNLLNALSKGIVFDLLKITHVKHIILIKEIMIDYVISEKPENLATYPIHQIISMDSYIVECLKKLIERYFPRSENKLLAVSIVDSSEYTKLLEDVIEHIGKFNGDTDAVFLANQLNLMRRRLVITHKTISRNKVLASWIALMLKNQSEEPSVISAVHQILLMACSVDLIEMRRSTDLEPAHTSGGYNATPVIPLRESDQTLCKGWTIPKYTNEDCRSPFEPSRYIEMRNGTFFNESSLISKYPEKFYLSSIGDDAEPKSLGMLQIRQASKRYRELGTEGNSAAVEIKSKPYPTDQSSFFLATYVNFGDNFGHFVYQMIPNILSFLINYDDGRPIVFYGKEKSFHATYFKMLNINQKRIIYLDEYYSVTGRISFFQESFGPHVNMSRIETLRTWFFSNITLAVPSTGKRVYLSRRHVKARTNRNEIELEAMLTDYGFDIVVPDGRTALEQISIIDNADVILSAHGSALTNLIFCRRPKIVIEGASKVGVESTSFIHACGNIHFWTNMSRFQLPNGSFDYEWNLQSLEGLLRQLP